MWRSRLACFSGHQSTKWYFAKTTNTGENVQNSAGRRRNHTKKYTDDKLSNDVRVEGILIFFSFLFCCSFFLYSTNSNKVKEISDKLDSPVKGFFFPPLVGKVDESVVAVCC